MDALSRKMMLRELMGNTGTFARNRKKAGGGGQFQLKPTSTISATQPTSAECGSSPILEASLSNAPTMAGPTRQILTSR